ncbi:hypothetical protein [Saccharospirillum salsuginis]|uniref:Porin n=1 Tax=Saccharospirillum salsuginis TaxID=418750 RepID=A0A918NGY4_9GAMM|nr:hypothetical protein [Saccharospirillum salsuginis]GGX69703.1 hypothetical protein GCM10007392_41620 [Saccharospirillum salsuginis]
MQRHTPTISLLITFPLVCGSALAAESRVTGNMQVQGTYRTHDGGDNRWTLQTPHSWLGVEAVEPRGNSRYRGVWQFSLDPLDEDAAAGTRQMFLEWQQSLYQIRAGRLATLEQRYLVDRLAVMNGSGDRGIAGAAHAPDFLDRTLQLDATNGELAYISAEWQIGDEDSDKTIEQWAVSTGLDTPEGQVSVTYRGDDQEAGLWGASVLWVSGVWSLGGGYLYRDETLAWDLLTQYTQGSVVSKLMYGNDAVEDADYWAFGIDQRFSQSIRNYSELRWLPESDDWAWQTGFRLQF